MHLLDLPTTNYTVYLPWYEPDAACGGKSNDDIAYTLTALDTTEGLPAWAVFDETAREIKINIVENFEELLGKSTRFELTCLLDGIEAKASFTVLFRNPQDDVDVEDKK